MFGVSRSVRLVVLLEPESECIVLGDIQRNVIIMREVGVEIWSLEEEWPLSIDFFDITSKMPIFDCGVVRLLKANHGSFE